MAGLRILQVIGGVAEGWGGPSKVVAEMSRHLGDRGHQVHVVTTDAAPRSSRIPRGVLARDGYTLRVMRSDLPRPPYPSTEMLAHVLREAKNFDIAHVHGLFNAPVTSAMLALAARGVPYLVRPCGMLGDYGMSRRGRTKRAYFRLLERGNLARAARIQVTSEAEHRAVEALGLTTPILHLPQGVEVLDLDGAGAGAGARGGAQDGQGERAYILFLSRVAHKKGLPLLVDAFARVAAQLPGLDLVIAGPDEHGHLRTIQGQVEGLGLSGRVRFPGMVRGQAKAALLAGATVFALPSLSENFGIVVVEAAAYGTPVLISPQVGLAPDVRAAGAGMVVAREVKAWAEALVAMVRAQEAGEAPWAKGCEAFAGTYRWGSIIERLEATYERVVAEARHGR